MKRPQARTPVGVRAYASTCAVLAVFMAALYFPHTPEELVRRPLAPGQVSAVVYIEDIGPTWTLLFGIAAIMLVYAAVSGKRYVTAYLASASTWALYGGAILFSSILTEPPVPIVTGIIGIGLAWQHVAAARAAKERGTA